MSILPKVFYNNTWYGIIWIELGEENFKMRFKINIKVITLYIMFIIFIGGVWKILIDTGELPALFYLDSDAIDIEDLMFNTWQVQVTISLISISLTSLIIGNLETKIYGQTIKSILMITDKLQMTYIDKIVLVILLSVANLWLIMYDVLPMLIIFFIFSIIGVLDLIVDSFYILFNPNKYESKVKRYIDKNVERLLENKENDLNEIVTNIRLSNKVLIDSGNVIEVDKNNKYLLEILSRILNDNKNSNLDQIENSIEECIIASIRELKDNNYIEECITIINQLLRQSINGKCKNWMLEECLTEVISKAKENGSHSMYIKISEYLLDNIYTNIDFKEINKSIVSIALFRYFYWIDNNNIINNFVKNEIIVSFINQLVPSQFDNLNYDKYEEEYTIKKLTIYKITKMLIENNDQKLFGELVNCIYKKNAYSINLGESSKNYEIIITISIYLYYIIVKEEACEKEYKELVNEFIYKKVEKGTKYERNIKQLVNEIGIYIWDSYEVIKREMPMAGWEYMPSGAAKFMIMDSVIDEYFLFYSIVNIQYYDYEEYINNKFNIENCYRILQYFNCDGMLKIEYIDSFKKYLKIYNEKLKYDSLELNIKSIFSITNKLYAQLLIEEEKSYYNMEIVNNNIEKLKNNIMRNIKESNKYIYINFIDNDYQNINYKIDISTSVMAEKSQLLSGDYEDIILNNIWNKILMIIGDIGYELNIKYSDDNKIKNLLSFIESKDLIANSIVNNRMSNNFYLEYNENNEDKLLLEKFEEGLNKIEIKKKVEYSLLIKEKRLDIWIEVEDIIISDIDDQDIENRILKYKISKNQYRIQIINDIFVIFTKQQIKEHFKYIYKQVDFKIKIKHNIKKKEVIKVNYDE